MSLVELYGGFPQNVIPQLYNSAHLNLYLDSNQPRTLELQFLYIKRFLLGI